MFGCWCYHGELKFLTIRNLSANYIFGKCPPPLTAFFLNPSPNSPRVPRISEGRPRRSARRLPWLQLPVLSAPWFRPRCIPFREATLFICQSNVQHPSHSDHTWDSAAVVHRRILCAISPYRIQFQAAKGLGQSSRPLISAVIFSWRKCHRS